MRGKTGNLKASQKMYRAVTAPKELKVVRGATHNFDEDGKQEELYRETVEWFQGFV